VLPALSAAALAAALLPVGSTGLLLTTGEHCTQPLVVLLDISAGTEKNAKRLGAVLASVSKAAAGQRLVLLPPQQDRICCR